METVVNEWRPLHGLRLPAVDAIRQADWGEFVSWSSVDRNAHIALQRVFDEIDGKLPRGGS